MKKTLLLTSITLFILASCYQQNQKPLVLAQIVKEKVKIEKSRRKELSFENVSFKYNENLITEVKNAVTPASPLENKDEKPDYVQSRNINFRLTYLDSKRDAAEISIYKVSEYANAFSIVPSYVQNRKKEFTELRKTLDKSAKLKSFGFEQLPYIPYIDAHLGFYSKAKVVKFQNGKGLLFLTQISQDAVSIINNEDLFYLFQGLTDDNQFFIFATFPVSAEGLPEYVEMNDKIADYEKNRKEYKNYVNDTAQKLKSLPNEKFTPNLSNIEDIISSLRVQ